MMYRFRRVVPLVLALLIAGAAGTAAAQQADLEHERARRLLVRGMTQVQIGDPEAALQSLEMALQLEPDEPAILAALADVHHALGDLSAALFYGERALRQNASNGALVEKVAQLQLSSGDRASATSTYRRLAREFPDDVASVAAAAAFLADEGHEAEGASILSDAFERHGVHPLLLEAVGAFDGAAVEDVVQRLSESVHREGFAYAELILLAEWLRGLPEVHPHDGLRAAIVERYPEIVAASSTAAAADPPSDSGEDVGPMAEPVGDDALASAREWERRIDDDPRQARNWSGAVEAFLRAGHPREARRIADEGVILFPGELELAVAAALSALEFDDVRRVRELLTPFAGIPAAELLLAYVAASEGDRSAASDHHRRAGEVTQSASLLSYRALMHGLLGQEDAARRDAEAALQLDPDHPLSREAAGWVHFLHGDPGRAAELLRSAADLGVDRPRVLRRLAEALDGAGRSDEATGARTRLRQAQ